MPAQVGIDFLSHIYSTGLSTEFPGGRDGKSQDLSQTTRKRREGQWLLIGDDVEDLLTGTFTPIPESAGWH